MLGTRDAGAAIRYDIFRNNLDDGFVDCLGVAVTGELGVLSIEREDELATIFEEFASAGLTELQLKVIGRPEPLQALIALMNDARSPVDEDELEGLDVGVLAELLRR